jgi:hypothetical protein
MSLTLAQDDLAAVNDLRMKAHYAVYFANRALVRRDWSDPSYVAGRAALDGVMVAQYRAKWRLGQFDGTYGSFSTPNKAPSVLREAADGFRETIDRAKLIASELRSGSSPRATAPVLSAQGTEILFSDDVPLVPTICPVVVLEGSNRDMGRQYARQVIEIYGQWIFARQAGRVFTETERAEIVRWRQELQRHVPETLEFARGWAEGATQSGLPMSEEQAVAILTGTRKPSMAPAPLGFAFADAKDDRSSAAYMGMPSKGDVAPEDLCSGIAAWGRGTTDGKLVAGSSTDHDMTYEATIVAFPSDGNAFVYTPFSANGAIPMLGEQFLSGHPGFNSKGMAYVHHAGGNTGEPKEQWGYGVRRGPMTLHLLQYADTAEAAYTRQLDFPVGDTAISLGSAGGLFADNGQAFAVEARAGCPDAPQPIVRTQTYDAYGRGHDVLYANNNAIDPRSGHLNAPPPEGYTYSLAGGWYTYDAKAIDVARGGGAMRCLMAKSSEGRNRYAYRVAMEGYGRIDLDYMAMAYRQGGVVPEGDFDALSAAWYAGGQWDCSVAHRNNALVALIKPDVEGGGIFRACMGPANRAVDLKDPGHGYYYYDETNAFWELRLKSCPEEVALTAAATAEADVAAAATALEALPADHAARAALGSFLQRARDALATGRAALDRQGKGDRDTMLSAVARAVRGFTTAQVRARQVIEAISPPPCSPEELVAAR